jgi:hypothetical protein
VSLDFQVPTHGTRSNQDSKVSNLEAGRWH